MKRKRFIILKRRKNLTENQQEQLQQLLEQNKPLYKGYLLKEQISDIFDEESYSQAMQRLQQWIENVHESVLSTFKPVLKTFKRYSYGIQNYLSGQRRQNRIYLRLPTESYVRVRIRLLK